MTTPSAHKGWTLAVSSLGLFMVALDTLVVTTALPVLRVALGASLADLEWTVNAYNLAFACLLLTGAALGDRFGRRRMFAIGLALFTAASAAAALSPNVGTLIAARTLQGAGAAIVMPLTLTLISAAFPAEKRGAAIGLWGGIAGLAVAAGPVVGGAVIDGIDWHWIFWLNVPIGIVAGVLAWLRLAETRGPEGALDLVGLGLASGGLLGVVFGVIHGNDRGWTDAEVVGAIAGSLADRFGNRPFMVAGLVMQAVGLGWVALIADTSVGYLELGTALTIAGVGTSLCFPTVANAVMSSVPMEEAGVASGTNSSLREVGGVFGVAVLAAVFTRHAVYASPPALVEGFRPALFVGAALTAAGIIAALLAPGRPASEVSGLAVAAEPVD